MFQASKTAQQKYIPGLTSRPANLPTPPGAAALTKPKPKEVPQELIDQFKNGTKQAVMCIHEYCSMRRLDVSFREVAVDYNYATSVICTFASVCTVDGKDYPQGVGATKKEAKMNAAKKAFMILLDLQDHSSAEDEEENVMFDSRGRKIYTDSSKGSFDSFNKQSMQQHQADAEKNPVAALQEFCASRSIPFQIDVSDEPGPMGFEAYVLISDDIIGSGTALNKKECKRLACQRALEYLVQTDQLKKSDEQPMTDEDHMAKLCHDKMHKMFEEVPQISHCYTSFAAFIVKKAENVLGEVVAVGTGNTCLSKNSITFDGRCVIDSYAVAMARRALLKYFSKEMKSYFEGNKIRSIFELISTDSTMLKLKDHISIHLYLSEPPCGDFGYYVQTSPSPSPALSPNQEDLVLKGAHFPAFSDEFPGWLCTKTADGEVNPVEEDQHPQQSLADLQQGGEELMVMSCSDKLLLWNVVGLQGALFSYFMDPIYLKSITVERHYDHGHFCRAVCCRVYDMLQEHLPQPYHINHPSLCSVSLPFPVIGEHRSMMSMNWSQGDEKVEVVDGLTGKTADISPHVAGPSRASRLCKAGFLHRFKEIAKLSGQLKLCQVPSYQVAKQHALKYQAAKQAFRSHCALIGVGNWVRNPPEIDNFVK